MKLTTRNTGVIENAEIKLDGITVIAGRNGTGKSTLGKVLYCIGKTLYDAGDNVREEKARQIRMIFNGRIYRRIDAIRFRVSPTEIYNLIENYNITGKIDYPEGIEKLIKSSESPEEIKEMIQYVLTLQPLSILERVFERAIEAELGDSILPSNHPKRVFNASLELDNKETIEVTKRKGHNCIIKAAETMEKDVVFIDDPSIIDNLSGKTIYSEVYNRFSHKADIENRLYYNKDNDSVISEMYGEKSWEELEKLLSDMCDGELVKSSGSGYQYVSSELQEPLSIESLSTGLKSILTLKTIIENGSMNNIGVLIVDEPEVHLHPEWQFQLAKILVLLPKAMNIKVMLSTHSSDFFSAIDYYSREYKMQKVTNYYQAQKIGTYSTVKDVTGQPDLIYQDLGAPFLRIADKL